MIDQLLILFKYSDFSLYYIFVFPSSILEYNLLKIIYDPQFSADYFYAIITYYRNCYSDYYQSSKNITASHLKWEH